MSYALWLEESMSSMWFDHPNKVLPRDLHSSHPSGKIPGQMGNSLPIYQPEAQAFCSPVVSFEIPNNSDAGRPRVDSVVVSLLAQHSPTSPSQAA